MDYRVYNSRQAESARVHSILNERRLIIDTVESQKTVTALRTINHIGIPIRKKDKMIGEPK